MWLRGSSKVPPRELVATLAWAGVPDAVGASVGAVSCHAEADGSRKDAFAQARGIPRLDDNTAEVCCHVERDNSCNQALDSLAEVRAWTKVQRGSSNRSYSFLLLLEILSDTIVGLPS